ncbi:hypothetical protein FGK63_13150 [Ruegeria sediminis]|uniref:LPS export ABC transporter periplasmic protein LptC n=1 Tax=Ruegeria sediminis TaxID=2583820 RepID=A0ABY2WXS3_9RHOB|nr:LPS export ABC transporter periplasmic protein LptC [Ruegeria sediminis]TMV07054.1 hypothetical protein FGK63_13150 [Ruegeria sediminis]
MDSYSRMVQFLKVLLPLAAIALLSTVFLLSRKIDTDVSGPFSPGDMDERLSGQLVTRPVYSGTTRKGEEIQVSATLARPGGAQSPSQAADLRGRIRFLNGREMTLDSDQGSLRPDRGTVTFTGNVVITTADGIRVTTDTLNTALDEISGDAPGTVTGTGPIGDFTAGRMQFGTETEDGPVHILFTDGVKLIYDPQKPER